MPDVGGVERPVEVVAEALLSWEARALLHKLGGLTDYDRKAAEAARLKLCDVAEGSPPSSSGQREREQEEALYSAHDFINRVLKWTGDDDTEQSELLTMLDAALSAPRETREGE